MFSNDNSGVVGGTSLIITVIGLLVTLWALRVTYLQLIRTKTASEEAALAINGVKGRFKLFDTAVECLKASKSLEAVLDHIRGKAWSYASKELWQAQTSLNRLAADLKQAADNTTTKRNIDLFSEEVRRLEDAADKGLTYDGSDLSSNIRQQIFILDKHILGMQRELYDE